MKGEIRERTVQGRQVIGALERVMKGGNVSIAVKRGREAMKEEECEKRTKRDQRTKREARDLKR